MNWRRPRRRRRRAGRGSGRGRRRDRAVAGAAAAAAAAETARGAFPRSYVGGCEAMLESAPHAPAGCGERRRLLPLLPAMLSDHTSDGVGRCCCLLALLQPMQLLMRGG